MKIKQEKGRKSDKTLRKKPGGAANPPVPERSRGNPRPSQETSTQRFLPKVEVKGPCRKEAVDYSSPGRAKPPATLRTPNSSFSFLSMEPMT